MVPSLALLSCESSVSVKENPDRKKNKKTLYPAYGQKDFAAVNLELLDNKTSMQL